ncbi:MAG: LacI family DNA-binding transcriptional regulator [Vannielia sp.]|uniref:LacI family DNA-binding transcriptional regulator n=1 Tax=Vannielia sp. TaxID=2813045 RepID=UPI003B8BC39D
MKRQTISDLAKAADVSVSTVNRVLNQPETVRKHTREHVLATAGEIGFYGVGTLERSVRKGRAPHRLGVLLQQGGRAFYRNLGAALRQEAARRLEAPVELTLTYVDDLSPDNIAAQLTALGKSCDALALVTAQHPKVADAIDALTAGGTPVIALVAPLTARANVGYVGLDSYAVGRTAAWAFDSMVHRPGEIGLLIGNHRYRNHELNEAGFRSYFREHNTAFTILEPRATHESAAVAREMVEGLFHDHPDLCGLFVSGGGITGALAALRDVPKRQGFVAVGYELFEATRDALIDGTLKMVISHPLDRIARAALDAMIEAKQGGPNAGARQLALAFEIYTSENI